MSDKQHYDFLTDVIDTVESKWNELDNNDEIMTTRHSIRMSKEYMAEFVFSVSEYLENMMDISPYMHSCNYILHNFELFEEMETFLYETYEEQAYINDIDETELEESDFQERVRFIGQYTADYVEGYMEEYSELAENVSSILIHLVFHLTLLIMLELEYTYLSFLDDEDSEET